MKDSKPSTRFKVHYSNLFWISLVHVGALAAIPFYNFANLMTVIIGVFLLAPTARLPRVRQGPSSRRAERRAKSAAFFRRERPPGPI